MSVDESLMCSFQVCLVGITAHQDDFVSDFILADIEACREHKAA